MDITILGTRGEVGPTAPYHSRHSGVLIDDTLMIDLGEREFLERCPKAVLITHLHPDHAYFVSERNDEIPAGLPVFAPEKGEIAGLKVLDKKRTIAGCAVSPIPTHHSLKVRSQAYRIEKYSRKILCTGDMIWIDKKYHPLLEGLDLVISEGSYLRKGGLVRRDKKTGRIYGHAGIPDLVRLFKDYCDHIIIVHFGSWFYQGASQARRQLRALAEKSGIDITAGYDNMKIVL
jgi:ribonuclease BN (tRNA processing enzyme)